jgi:NADP-dependent 3-hydroxy acid dehydrogenase YdfG
MTKPIMLITGTSRGIGLECASYFNNTYTIVGISRTPGEFVTEVGDITDPIFRNTITEKYTPDVFINNAGVSGNSETSELFRTNIEAAGCLLLSFYKKMPKGHIINLSSWNANMSGGVNSGLGELAYKSSKLFIKNLSNNLSNKRNKPLLITSLEPQVIYTDMMSKIIPQRPTEDCYKNYNFESYTPMSTTYIAETIQWIITQPSWVCIKSLEISNSYKIYQ